MNDLIIHFCRPIIAITIAAGAWITESIVANIDAVPGWIDKYGLPLVFLAAVVYALVSTNRALRDSEAGRLRDRDEFMTTIREDSRRAVESREKLHAATTRQTEVFEKMIKNLEDRPCQIGKISLPRNQDPSP